MQVLFGDNQFFGVNHMSEERARAQAMKFQGLDAVMEVLDAAYDVGITSFMCTTHERVAEICDRIRANPQRYKNFELLPCMPYAHKYANAVTENGLLGALKSFLPDDGAFRTAMRGGVAFARKDVESMARLLVDAEMKMFHGLKTPAVFLQNVMADLILGLGMYDVFRMFADHVRERYDAEPGFITMNLPRMLDALEACGVVNPIVCTNFNKAGFRMSGGLAVYEEAVRTRAFRPIAMSVLASGAIAPREAVEYVCSFPNIQAIVFGASSRANIRQTKTLIDQAVGRAA
jgi:hypothetical protein